MPQEPKCIYYNAYYSQAVGYIFLYPQGKFYPSTVLYNNLLLALTTQKNIVSDFRAKTYSFIYITSYLYYLYQTCVTFFKGPHVL